MSEEFQKFSVLWHWQVMVCMNEVSCGIFVSTVCSR